MTRPDLDAIAALLDKATPGPWRTHECSGGGLLLIRNDAEMRHMQPYLQIVPSADAALIVAAVNALPGLLAYVRELERERDAAALAMRERCAQACMDAKPDRAAVKAIGEAAHYAACAAAIRALEAP